MIAFDTKQVENEADWTITRLKLAGLNEPYVWRVVQSMYGSGEDEIPLIYALILECVS